MRKIFLIILLFQLSFVVLAQQPKQKPSFRESLRRASQMNRLRKSTDIVELQTAIDNAKTSGQYVMAIYYELQLAEQYEKMDDFGIAEVVFLLAYEDAKAHLPLKHNFMNLGDYLISASQQKTYFDPIDRLGYFYLTIGNLKSAEQLFQESKKLRDNYFPKHSIHRVLPMVGMGSYYFKKGQYDKTYQFFNQAQATMARVTTTGYDFDNVNRLFFNDLVELCLILGKKNEAFKYLNRLAIASSGFGKFNSRTSSSSEIARVFELKSRCYLAIGDFKKSQEYLEKANHYNPTNASASVVKLKILKTETLLNWYQGKVELSSLAFQKLISTYREHIQENFDAMSDYEREQFYYLLKDDFDLFNAFVLDNSKQAIADSLYGQVYNNVLNTKGLLLNETNRLKNEILHSGNPMLIGKLNQWEKDKDKLAAMYFEKNTPGQIDSLEKSIEKLEREINQSSGLFRKKEKGLAWQSVKSNLKDGEAAIEIIRVNTFNKSNPKKSAIRNGLTDSIVYMMLMITPQSKQPECFYQFNGKQLENRFLPYYRNSILAKTDDNFSYDNFWRTIKTHLSGIKKVFISADGVYNQINLNTLKNPSTNNYLIDETELVMVTNSGDLLSGKTENQTKDAFLIGRPAFEFSQAQITTALSSPSASLANGTRSLTSEELINFKDQNFADLPGTAEEVSLIASILKKQDMNVTSYTGADALEEKIKSLKRPEVLHIATHGFFVEDTAQSINPMIRSGIILAGVRNTENKNKEDGILTAYEATNLDLEGTDLVALSACQTGLGEVHNGEGVYGLQRSIMVAGAKNLLMSLWKVDDEATAKLMSAFYGLRSGKSNLEAFREAQIELRKTYPEPFYWGAFVMLGK